LACGAESRRRAALALVLMTVGCGRHASPVGDVPAATSTPVAAPDAGSTTPDPFANVAEAVREERWDNAWTLLDLLPPAVSSTPEVRYARARVAMERHDAKGALASLDGLEQALPLLADDVARERAEAELDVGPFDVAGEWFFARGTPTAYLKAAHAFRKAKLDARAKAACDRVLTSEKRTRAQEAEARAMEIELAPNDKASADDARWLAVHAPDLKLGHGAERTLQRLGGKPLTSDELLARAEAWSLASRPDEATQAIDRAAHAPGRPVPALEVLRAKGDALYRGGRYGDAARVLGQCAASGGPHAAEDAFRAARALARADRDEESILALGHVAKTYASTPWGEQAEFLAAKLVLLHARWSEAATALDTYLTRHPNGQDRREATRDRALAWLLAGEVKKARPLFEELAEDGADPLAAARAGTMAALAALRDGDRTHAIARWTDVARSRPLSWPALVARARLVAIGAPLPPVMDPGDPAPDPPLSVALPPPVDLLHRVGLDDEAEDELHEREATMAASASPGRSVEALCDAYGALSRAKRRYQVAQQVPAPLLAASPTAKTRWAWDCAFPSPYAGDVAARSREASLPSALLYAVMRQESGFDPDVVSPARAVGLLQLLPETARAVEARRPRAKVVAADAGTDEDDTDDDDDSVALTSPAKNIALGSRYLADLVARFHGALPLAVAAYNAGPDAIARWLSRRGEGNAKLDVDLFVERIPYAETRLYVAKVMGNYARYAYLNGGDAAVPSLPLELP
jgi:soluble lytic murein transglycosylase